MLTTIAEFMGFLLQVTEMEYYDHNCVNILVKI